MKKIDLPLNEDKIKDLRIGDEIYLYGYMYVGRDQVHKRFFEILKCDNKLPIDIENETIYYMGPTPTPEGKIIGSCGPTTSKRMDNFTPILLDYGLKGMIGKGPRSEEVIKSIRKNKAIYFYAYGGCGALYSECIKEVKIIAFEELLTEALYKIRVEEFPVIVAIDSFGNNIFERNYKLSGEMNEE